jgi:hypothetical protein
MKTITNSNSGVKVNTTIKAGGIMPNHSRRGLALANKSTPHIKVNTGIKAGGIMPNHSRRGLRLSVKTGIKAGEGIIHFNHNRIAL